ncbi:hypothetical protein JCM11641_000468 [Rhodosporidiobolus odoratus]
MEGLRLDILASPSLSVNPRFSVMSLDMPESECGVVSPSLPYGPLLPNSPGASPFLGGMPRSGSGQSIPIFFQPEDLHSSRGSRIQDKDPFATEEDEDEQAETASLLGFYTSSSSIGTSSRLSFDSSSVASNSTAPSEPPTPLTPTTHDKPFALSPPSPAPSPLPTPAVRSSTHTYPPSPPLLNARRNVASRPGTAESLTGSTRSRPGTAGSCSCSSPPSSPVRVGSAGGVRTSRSQNGLNQLSQHQRFSRPPPSDAFYEPASPHRPSTASSVGSYQPIPIRLVPPTPTADLREVRAATSPFRRAAAANVTPPASPRPSPPSPPRLGTASSSSSNGSTSKPLPSLPIFPTVARPLTATSQAGRRTRTPPESEQEGVYNVPLYPPCIYPPSVPAPSFGSPARKTLRSAKSTPFLSGGGSNKGYSRIPPRTSPAPMPAAYTHPRATLSTAGSNASAASFDTVATTFFLPIPGETILQLTIDQEGFREAVVEFEYTGTDDQSGLLEFVAKTPEIGREREGWPFHVGFLQTPPYLRRLAVAADPARDYLPREACLSVAEKDGVYKVSSAISAPTTASSPRPYYCFAYEVKERLNLIGKVMKGERLLKPLVFICSRDFLHPVRGRKIGLKEIFSKAFALPATATLVKSSAAAAMGSPKHPATRG